MPLVLLTGCQIPAAIRRIGAKRLETWLRNRHVVRSDRLAEGAVQAADRQHTSLPGEKLAAQLVHALAKAVPALHQQVAELYKRIESRFRLQTTFEVITSRSGIRPVLGAVFLAATSGDMAAFSTAGRLASLAASRRCRGASWRSVRLCAPMGSHQQHAILQRQAPGPALA